MRSPDWIVWYADGSSITSDEKQPHEVPRWDVLCIVANSKNWGREIWHRNDYYIWEDQWEPGEWVSVDKRGLEDYLDRPGKEKIRLRGRHVPSRIFWEVYFKAERDPRMPPKSGTDPLEQNQ